MNTGIIAARYARALFKLTLETGNGAQVCAQVRQILKNPDQPCGKLEPELEQFTKLLIKKGRLEYLKLALNNFVDLYLDSAGIKLARLTLAAASPAMEKQLHERLEKFFNCTVEMETVINPEIIGGFKIDIDGKALDATVLYGIKEIRKQFEIKNNRLV